ncbi:transthyretin-like family domain-containing protein [Ditylenchus destructor]|uniref:Transthyretin-like family domain-containing protein n=1 Tax=Ditylenchus destructor TaxID=166010 RepID=A0AAD4MTJ8_9BILA|nr:transthyretin-like family domain-containing protein [Ditylenchus destructor]
MNESMHLFPIPSNQFPSLPFHNYKIKMLYRRMTASIMPVKQCLRNFKHRASQLSETLQCQMYIFIPSLFIVTAVLLLTAVLLFTLHINVGKQKVVVRGQVICCSTAKLHAAKFTCKPWERNMNLEFESSKENGTFISTNYLSDAYDTKISINHCWVVPKRAVELYDYDWLTSSDLLAETHTDENGMFELSGETEEFFQMLPYIVIYHRCNIDTKTRGMQSGHKHRVRRSQYYIPPHSINGDSYDLFPLNLQILGWRDTLFDV